MLKIINIMFILMFVHTVTGQTINFLSSLDAAKTEAMSEDKLIFVDVMADWCGPCKLMEKEMNADTSLISYYNEHFVNLKINEKNNKTLRHSSFPQHHQIYLKRAG